MSSSKIGARKVAPASCTPATTPSAVLSMSSSTSSGVWSMRHEPRTGAESRAFVPVPSVAAMRCGTLPRAGKTRYELLEREVVFCRRADTYLFSTRSRNRVSPMLFQIPDLGDPERSVLGQVDDLKQKLRHRLYEPRRWSGSLRHVQFAHAVQGSNSIEGYNASLDDAAAIDLGEAPLDADEETRLAIKGYRDA